MTYALFGEAAARYDWHTPPHHYQDDHAFVLSKLPSPPAHVLDVGCGTGVFLEKALTAGFDASGIDSSPEMIDVAARRVGDNRVKTLRMQELPEDAMYDAIVSLSWSFNYVESFDEAGEVLSVFHKILNPGGLLILQIAHAPNASGTLNEDREPGPEGQLEDITFLYRFHPDSDSPDELIAQYVYGCKSRNELVFEKHTLRAADAYKVADEARHAGFTNIELLDSWRDKPLEKSFNVFLLANRP